MMFVRCCGWSVLDGDLRGEKVECAFGFWLNLGVLVVVWASSGASFGEHSGGTGSNSWCLPR